MLAVVMQAWNETEGITGCLSGLRDCLREQAPFFVVNDDFSLGDTGSQSTSLIQGGFPVEVLLKSSEHGTTIEYPARITSGPGAQTPRDYCH